MTIVKEGAILDRDKLKLDPATDPGYKPISGIAMSGGAEVGGKGHPKPSHYFSCTAQKGKSEQIGTDGTYALFPTGSQAIPFGLPAHGSVNRQIGCFAQKSICDDEIATRIAGVRSWAVDHSAEKPVAVQWRDGRELILAETSRVTEVLGQ